MNGTLYRIFNLINGKSYIGKTYNDPYNRLAEHIRDSKRYLERPLYRAFNKYGLDNFSFEILLHCEQGLLEDKEIEYISKYNSYGNTGYNATLGGEGRRYIDICMEALVEQYRDNGNLTTTAKIFGIDSQSVKRMLIDYGEPLVKFDGKTHRRKLYSKKVYIPEVDMVFVDPYECARFLIGCDIVSNTSNEISVAMSIRRVCAGIRQHYQNIYFEYTD